MPERAMVNRELLERRRGARSRRWLVVLSNGACQNLGDTISK